MNIDKKIVDDLVANDVSFVTTVPCKQLAGVIEEVENRDEIFHIPSNKEDEGMGLCAGAFMGGKRPMIIMQNTALGVTLNTLGDADAVLPHAAADADQLPRRVARTRGLSGRNGCSHQGAVGPVEHPDLPLPLAKGCRRVRQHPEVHLHEQ